MLCMVKNPLDQIMVMKGKIGHDKRIRWADLLDIDDSDDDSDYEDDDKPGSNVSPEIASSLESKLKSLGIFNNSKNESNKVLQIDNLRLEFLSKQIKETLIANLASPKEVSKIESEQELDLETKIETEVKTETKIETTESKGEEQLTENEEIEEIKRPSSACSSLSSSSSSEENILPVSFPPRKRHHIGEGVYSLCSVLRFAKVGRIARPNIYYHSIEGNKKEKYTAPTLVQAVGQVPSIGNQRFPFTVESRDDHDIARSRHGDGDASLSPDQAPSYACPRGGNNWRPPPLPPPPHHAPSMNYRYSESSARGSDSDSDRRYGESSANPDPRYGENGWRRAVPPWQQGEAPFGQDDQAPYQPNYTPFYAKQKAQRAYYEQQQHFHRERYPPVPPPHHHHHDRGIPPGYWTEGPYERPPHLADQFPPWRHVGGGHHFHNRGETMLPPWVATGQDRYDSYADCCGSGGGYNDNWREDVDLVRKGILNRTSNY